MIIPTHVRTELTKSWKISKVTFIVEKGKNGCQEFSSFKSNFVSEVITQNCYHRRRDQESQQFLSLIRNIQNTKKFWTNNTCKNKLIQIFSFLTTVAHLHSTTRNPDRFFQDVHHSSSYSRFSTKLYICWWKVEIELRDHTMVLKQVLILGMWIDSFDWSTKFKVPKNFEQKLHVRKNLY